MPPRSSPRRTTLDRPSVTGEIEPLRHRVGEDRGQGMARSPGQRLCRLERGHDNTPTSSAIIFHDQELRDHAVAPLAVELAVVAMDTDFREAEALQQGAARRIFRKTRLVSL